MILAESGDRLVGGVPLLRRPGRFFSRCPEYRAFSDLETYSAGFLIDPEYEGNMLPAVIDYLNSHSSGWFSLMVERVEENSDSVRLMMNTDSARVFSDFDGFGSYIEIPNDIDIFTKSLSTKFHRNLKRQNKRLIELGDVEYRFVGSEEADESCFHDFIELEASGWKGKKGTAIACSKKETDFYRSLTQRLAKKGMLQWNFLRIEGKTIAGHLAVRMGKTLTLFKIAYHEDYSRCSPGNMLFLELAKHEIENKLCDEIDCMTDMQWNRKWGMPRHRYYNLTAFPRRIIPTLAGYLPLKTGENLRKIPILRKAVNTVRKTLHRD